MFKTKTRFENSRVFFYIAFYIAMINIKRIYKPAEDNDGFRILVDRLWPRGISKEAAKLDLWLKEIAPSTELRKQFHHSEDPDKWDKFKAAYLAELEQNEAVQQLKDLLEDHKTITLLYSVPDEHQNHALILREFISPRE
jgi:uncharacterized protein YeaO (DUF488 family)